MSTDTREDRLASRIAELFSTDRQFADAAPDAAVTDAIDTAGSRLPQIIETVFAGYHDRPALGQRVVQFVEDPQTGRTSAELLPEFDTLTYGELSRRVHALVGALTDVHPGDRVAVLGFTSVDYTTIDIALTLRGAVSVPLQTAAQVTALRPIIAETQPVVIASAVDYLADAVDLAMAAATVTQVLVFDYLPEVDDHRDALDAARNRVSEAASTLELTSLQDAIEIGTAAPPAQPHLCLDPDPLTMLIYTSGSTGAPKGAMYTERLVAGAWRPSKRANWGDIDAHPSITLNFMPMSHVMGRMLLYGTLGAGGTAYFAARSDLSTFLADLALVRPTQLSFVPRIWDMIFAEVATELDRRPGTDDDVFAELRQSLLGGRYVMAMTGSAPLSAEMRRFVENFLDLHLIDGYGSTEAGSVLIDGHVQRPPVIDYKLVDVPELGYFHTDRPHPRGELLIKSDSVFAGYYKRPEITAEMFDPDGYYRTGDVVAETAPDELVYLDRRNNVLKLSQGEFVAVSKLEAVFGDSPLIRQIYLYGNSTESYLLAVVVPTDEALAHDDVKSLIAESLQDVAKTSGLQSFEIPRDFLIETTPFTLENGLLTGVRKLARPKLRERYADRLETRYAELAASQAEELRGLRLAGAQRPVLDTVSRAAGALLGTDAGDLRPDAHFTDLGGDSLSALTFANLLNDIFEVEVPVGVIVSPATDLQGLADYIDAERQNSSDRPTFASVHGRSEQPVTEAHASDLTLDKFVEKDTLEAATALPGPSTEVRTVLLTGATGFLGRYLALEWLERLSMVGGTLVCLVRAKDDATARERLDRTFDGVDPALWEQYRRLAADHLEVIAGDKGEADLGLDRRTWQRLADSVDLIVDSAALVNHVLPYSQLFGPNALGTAELIRVALTTKLKPFAYVSTIGVGAGIEPGSFTESGDIRQISATRVVDDSYANGYGTSKWAGEVLLREAHDLCGLPVAVFRCDMILADTTYAGQLNLPDMFTRLILSLVTTGVAPDSFYQVDADGHRQRAHYDGLPVEFVAEAISTLGAHVHGDSESGFETYHVMNPYDDGIGLDEFVDWLIDAGYPISRVGDYSTWLQRFTVAINGLPDRQRQASLLPLLHNYQRPEIPVRGSVAPTDQFRTAVQNAKIGPDKDIPHVTRQVIVKYVTDLQQLGLI
jgi:fatty acid CoA ligase FadD9